MRVLILCNDFPPLNSIGARRPYGWFSWFKQYGAEPIVVTKQWTAIVEKPEDVLKNFSSAKINIEENDLGTIIRVPVKLIPPEEMMLKFGEEKKGMQRKFLTLIYKMFSFCFFSFDKHAAIYFAARNFLKNQRTDVILITGEPFVLFRYGYLLSKEFNIPWVADYRDGWKLNHVTRFRKDFANRFLQWWEFYFEKKFLGNCKLITGPDEILSEELGKLHHKKFRTVYNGYEELQDLIVPKHSKILLIAHTGTLTQGQRVEFLLQSILELHNEKKIQSGDLLIQFTGLEYYSKQNLRVKNFNSEILCYLKTTHRISREDSLKINAASDFLIAFTEEKYQAIYAKVYDYLGAQKPILVLPDDNGLLSNFVKETQTGISFSEKNEFKKFLLEQIELKKSGVDTMKINSSKEKIKFYSRQKQAEQMVQFLKEATTK